MHAIVTSNPASLFLFGGPGGKKRAWYPLFAHSPVFPRNLGIRISLGYFRYMIVIIDGGGCTTSIVMLHASYSFTRAPLLLLFVSPSEEGTTHTAVKAVYDGKDVFVCLPNWI